MNKSETLKFLIEQLKSENQQYADLDVPAGVAQGKNIFRSLMNIRIPGAISAEYLKVQDQYLQDEIKEKGVVYIDDIPFIEDKISLWRGDITSLKVDAIVNAANSKMLGCFVPCHRCIDNAIHSAAGVQLRNECAEIMDAQGFDEPTGKAKITGGYNLPAKYVIHTVGPIIYDRVTQLEKQQLESCYYQCLKLADEKGLKSIAFCCISTGEFRFPNELAAEIAVETVRNFLEKENKNIERVIFNVFKEDDERIYERLFSGNY